MSKITENKLIAKLLRSDFIKSVFSISTGNLIAQIIALITVPILTRIYSNEAYGEYGIISSTVTIIVSFATLGLSSAIMAPKEEAESKKILLTGLWVQGVVTVLIGIGACAVYPKYSMFNVGGSYYVAVAIMCVYVFLVNTNSLLRVYVNRVGLNKILLINPIVGAVSNFLIAIPLGRLGVGYIGFFVALIVGNTIMNVQMIVKSKPFDKGFRPSDAFRVFRDYKAFILFQCPANILSNTGTQWPVQYLSKHFSNAQLSYYTLACNVLQYPIRLIAAPIGTVYFRKISRLHNEGKDISRFTFRLVVGSMLVAFVPMVLFIVWGGPICGFLLGDKWGKAGEVAGIIILQYVLLFCSQCTSYCKVTLGKQKTNLAFGVISLLLTAVASWLGYKCLGTLMGTIFFCTVSRCIVNIIEVALNFFCLKKYLLKYLLFVIPYSVLTLGIIVLRFIF